MPVRRPKRSAELRARPPMSPKQPSSVHLATVEEHDLADEATYHQLAFFDLGLSGRSAELVEFEECQFRNTDLRALSYTLAAALGITIEDSGRADS